MSADHRRRRLLGVTVLGDFILSEGVETVLDNLQRIGATAVATNPTVTAPAPDGQGSFQPPSDAGSSPRVFDRPLFGRRSLWVRSGPSYVPNAGFYRDSPYPPRKPNELTEQHGEVIGCFIRAAIERGLEVYLQVGATQPSGLRDEDRPRLPTGEIPPGRMADTGSLASLAIRAYNRAYVQDLVAAYPQITGLRPDWPEYPCYTLGECFQDFSPHVEQWTEQHGYDFGTMRYEISGFYSHLHGHLAGRHLLLPESADRLLDWLPVGSIQQWLRLKAELSVDTLSHWADALVASGGVELKLSANAFMPPWSVITGFDFCRGSGFCSAVSPKLYTMHWSQMVDFWGRELLTANPGLDETLVVRALTGMMGIADRADPRVTLADWGYPEPHEVHPVSDDVQRRKLEHVVATVGQRCDVTPLVHGYGPAEDFARRFRVAADSNADGVWINRYGYLSDEKLERVADAWESIGERRA